MSKRNRFYEDDEAPFINQEMMDRVDWVVDDSILHDDTYKIDERDLEETRHLSELYRVVCNMDKKELAVCVAVATEKYPFMVMQWVAEYVIRLKEGNGK